MHPLVTEAVLPLGLFLMMFGMGLSLTRADFSRVLQAPKPALVGISSLLILVPSVGFALATVFDLPAELAAGLVLVAACPGGMFSNLMTDYARGNLALSVTLTAVTSVVSIFTIPGWTGLALRHHLGQQTAIALPFAQTLVPLLLFVLLPTALGMLVRSKAAAWASANTERIKNAAAAIVLVIMIYLASVQESEAIDNLPSLIAAVIVLNVTSVAIGATMAWMTRLDRPDRVAVAIEHAVRQEGTGIYIAASLIGSPMMALPLMLNSAVGMTIAVIVVLRQRLRKPAAELA